jgi:hypothetical protein
MSPPLFLSKCQVTMKNITKNGRWYVQLLVWCKPGWDTFCNTSKTRTHPTDESRVKNHTKSTNHPTNTITMVAELPSPLAAWI